MTAQATTATDFIGRTRYGASSTALRSAPSETAIDSLDCCRSERRTDDVHTEFRDFSRQLLDINRALLTAPRYRWVRAGTFGTR